MEQQGVLSNQNIKPEDFQKIKRFLVDRISNDIEAVSTTISSRKQAVIQALDLAYEQTKIVLAQTTKDQLYREILDELVRINTDLGPLPPPKTAPKPWSEKPDPALIVVIVLVASAIAALVYFFPV